MEPAFRVLLFNEKHFNEQSNMLQIVCEILSTSMNIWQRYCQHKKGFALFLSSCKHVSITREICFILA